MSVDIQQPLNVSDYKVNSDYKFVLQPSPQSDLHFQFDTTDNLPDSYKKLGAPNSQTIPNSINYRPLLKPCRDQGQENACVSFSACGAKEYQERINCNFCDYFSPQFIYNNRYDTSSDSGMSIYELVDILQKTGVCSENDCLYGKSFNKNDISKNIYDRAHNFRIKAYAQIKSLDGLKLALAQNGPCLVGVNIYNFSNQPWKPSKSNEQQQGGHCMLAVSYDDNSKRIGIRNSWGCTDWGDQGYAYMPYDDFKYIIESWTIIDDTTSINVYVPQFDNKQIPTPTQSASHSDILLVTAIQEMIPIPNQVVHRVWIRLVNKAQRDYSNIKLAIECDKLLSTWKVNLVGSKQVDVPEILKPNQEYVCGIECEYKNKKPLVSIFNT